MQMKINYKKWKITKWNLLVYLRLNKSWKMVYRPRAAVEGAMYFFCGAAFPPVLSGGTAPQKNTEQRLRPDKCWCLQLAHSTNVLKN